MTPSTAFSYDPLHCLCAVQAYSGSADVEAGLFVMEYELEGAHSKHSKLHVFVLGLFVMEYELEGVPALVLLCGRAVRCQWGLCSCGVWS